MITTKVDRARAAAPVQPPDGGAARAAGVKILDTPALLECQPAPLDYLFNQWAFTAGTVGVITAPGDSGKSYLALELAASLALAGEAARYDPLEVAPVAPRAGPHRVVYVSGEDNHAALWNRLHRIGDALDPDARRTLASRLTIASTLGANPRPLITGDALLDYACNTWRGSRLIIFDTLTRFHRENENDNGAMSAVIARFETIATKTGAAVLILHHTSKAAFSSEECDPRGLGRGASAIRDNPRWGLTGVVRAAGRALAETKHNDGRAHDDVTYMWTDDPHRGPFVRSGAAHVPAASGRPAGGDDEDW